jgi:hypothetical protein
LGSNELVMISFVSGEFVRYSQINQQQQFDNLVNIAQMAVPEEALSSEVRKELIDDVRSFRQQLANYIPEPGAMSNFVWRSGRGLEGLSYQWAGGKALQAGSRLSILDHTGGSLAFFAARTKTRPEDYEFASRFLERLIYHSEKISLPQLQAADREMYEQVRRELAPLVVRWRSTVREKIIPALADGQTALVVDGRTTSTQWHQMVPASPKPLPIPEIAFVLGVTNPAQLKQGVSESMAIAQEAFARLHKLFPEKVPDIKIPAVGSREFPGGTVFYYALPSDAGFDKQVALNAGLGKDVAVLSFIPKQTARLLERVTPSFEGPLSRASEPLAAAAYVNVAGAVAAVRPWLEYAVELAEKENVAEPQVQAAKDPVRVVLDVLSCIKQISAVTYSDGSAAVSHFEWHIQDLE